MSIVAILIPNRLIPASQRPAAIAAAILSALLVFALGRRLAHGGPLLPSDHSMWLTLHLVSVIPALPLGAWILFRRKGDRPHKMLGRIWVLMMMTAALSSFGLKGMTGQFSWIHLLSILVLVMVPRGVMQAVRGDIVRHQRTMTRIYIGLVTAGAFTFLPGRLLGSWLFG